MPNNSKQNRGKLQKRHKDEIIFRKGDKINIPNHPTEFMSRPWFQLVLRIDNPGTSVTLGQIHGALGTQLGFTPPAATAYRFLDLRLWGPLPVTANALIMIVFDIFTPGVGGVVHGVLEQITNYADAVNRARIGYRFPTAQQQQSNVATSTTATPLCSISGAGPSAVLYIKLLWRVQATIPAMQPQIYPNLCSSFGTSDCPPTFEAVCKQCL